MFGRRDRREARPRAGRRPNRDPPALGIVNFNVVVHPHVQSAGELVIRSAGGQALRVSGHGDLTKLLAVGRVAENGAVAADVDLVVGIDGQRPRLLEGDGKRARFVVSDHRRVDRFGRFESRLLVALSGVGGCGRRLRIVRA